MGWVIGGLLVAGGFIAVVSGVEGNSSKLFQIITGQQTGIGSAVSGGSSGTQGGLGGGIANLDPQLHQALNNGKPIPGGTA